MYVTHTHTKHCRNIYIFGGREEMEWSNLKARKSHTRRREKKQPECNCVYGERELALFCIYIAGAHSKISTEKSIFLFIMTWIQWYSLCVKWEMLCSNTYPLFHFPIRLLFVFWQCICQDLSLSLSLSLFAGSVDMVSLEINFGKIHFQRVSSTHVAWVKTY